MYMGANIEFLKIIWTNRMLPIKYKFQPFLQSKFRTVANQGLIFIDFLSHNYSTTEFNVVLGR